MSARLSDPPTVSDYDVLVVGHGVAGLSTGIAAHERGASTVVLEKSPKEKRGGHTQYAGGVFRFPMEDPERVRHDLALEDSVDRYTKRDFLDDLDDVSEGRADPELCDVLAENAYGAITWAVDNGVSFHVVDHSDEPGFGSTIGTVQADGEGEGVVESLAQRADELGIDRHYDTEMRRLLTNDANEVSGVVAHTPDGKVVYEVDAVVICAGSYVSNPEKRTRYFGRDGDVYVVRGSRYNTGEALDAALDAGAMPAGQWGGAHQVLNDANAPRVEGGRARINGYQYGVILNTRGERFLDEGEDVLLKTYAKFGQRVYDQPDQKAFVVFDSSVDDLVVSQMGSDPVAADTLQELFEKVGIETEERALETVRQFNAATDVGTFDPHNLDGNATAGIEPRKSNWAVPLDEPPFKCFPVDTAMTFAFGGLKIDTESRVLNTRENPVDGLWAVGNSTAGFFYGNYPGGAALTRGVTFGRRAGRNAADYTSPSS